MSSPEAYQWRPGEPCPCGCDEIALKISFKTGHVLGCKCRRCVGRRSQRKGRRAQSNAHRLLGGEGVSPSNEESGRAYELRLLVRPEVKKGGQVSKKLLAALSLAWTERALWQADRGAGGEVLPALYLEPEGSTDGWLIVRVAKR